MTDLRVRSRLTYAVEARTSFVFSIVVARTPCQDVTAERISVVVTADDGTRTEVPVTPVTTGEESTQRLLRLTVESGELEVAYDASVTIDGRTPLPAELDEVPFDEIPIEILTFLNPSRYCESDVLGDFAWRHFGHLDPGHARVQAISDWVRWSLLYVAGTTDGSSSATDVLLQRVGVCRDFAHVAIALCRALGVPARYVSGYGVGVKPQDFHGFFEAYVGTDWYLFDPTGMAMSNALVRIADGRDAADASFATLVGPAVLTDMSVDVTVVGALPSEPPATSTA